jgi:cytochrome c oxidase subunit 2
LHDAALAPPLLDPIDMKTLIVAATVFAGVTLLPGAHVSGQDRDPLAARGERVFVTQGCYGCHLVGRFGTPIGPDLSHIGAKYPVSYLRSWVRDPESVRPTAHMPKLELNPEEVQGLAAYLASLK